MNLYFNYIYILNNKFKIMFNNNIKEKMILRK